MEVLVAIVLAAAVAAFVSAPLRREALAGGASDDVAALEAAKEAKYREIRDLELDRAAGKIDAAEFAAANRELRAEAIAILDQLDNATAASGPATAGPTTRRERP